MATNDCYCHGPASYSTTGINLVAKTGAVSLLLGTCARFAVGMDISLTTSAFPCQDIVYNSAGACIGTDKNACIAPCLDQNAKTCSNTNAATTLTW